METLGVEKLRVASFLQHFFWVTDFREPWRVAGLLREVLPLTVCGAIAADFDYDDIVDWGKAHRPSSRADWRRTLMNRINPGLFVFRKRVERTIDYTPVEIEEELEAVSSAGISCTSSSSRLRSPA